MGDRESGVRYCPECGQQVYAEAAYCDRCGADISDITGAGSGRGGEEAPQEPHGEPGQEPTGLVTRRRVLIGGGAVLVGGAAIVGLGTLSEPEHRIYGEGWDVERSQTTTGANLEGTLELPAERYAAWELTPQTSVRYTIDFDVVEGEAIDVFVTDDDEYDRYRERDEDFQVYLRARESTGEEMSEIFSADEYRLIFDNTAVFGAQPGSDVTIELTVEASVA